MVEDVVDLWVKDERKLSYKAKGNYFMLANYNIFSKVPLGI